VISVFCRLSSDFCPLLGRPGGDLLSHALRRSTIGAEGFHGRVRDGIGWDTLAITTRSSKQSSDDGDQGSGIRDQIKFDRRSCLPDRVFFCEERMLLV
jgi:hypothetical protein